MNILQFWLAADNFQNQLAAKKGQYDGLEAQNDAMILYDKYVLHPLSLTDVLRCHLGVFYHIKLSNRCLPGLGLEAIHSMVLFSVSYLTANINPAKCTYTSTHAHTHNSSGNI